MDYISAAGGNGFIFTFLLGSESCIFLQ